MSWYSKVTTILLKMIELKKNDTKKHSSTKEPHVQVLKEIFVFYL